MPERTNLQIDFSGGTDERTDERHVLPGKLTSLVNGTFEKTGSIRGRRGFTALSRSTFAGGTLSAAVRLGTFGMDLVASDGDALYSYSPTVNKWAYKDQLPQPSVTRSPVTHGSTTFYSPDVAYGNGYLVFAWRENVSGSTGYGDVVATVVDVTTGAQVLSNVTIARGVSQTYPRVVVVGTTAIVCYGNASGQIRARTLDLTNPTAFGSAATLVSDASTNVVKAQFDVCAMSDRFAIVYVNNNTGGVSAKLQVATFAATLGTALATRTLLSVTDPDTWMLGIRGTTGEGIWITYGYFLANTVSVWATYLNASTLADVTAPFSVTNTASTAAAFPVGIERLSSTRAVVVWGEQDSATNVKTSKWHVVDHTGAGSIVTPAARYLRRHFFLSKPFLVGSRAYALVCYGHNTFSSSATAYVIDLTVSDTTTSTLLARPVATIAPRRTSTQPVTDTSANLCGVPAVTATTNATATVVRKSADGKLGLDWSAIDFATASRHTMNELGGSLHLSGGVPCIYDGARVIENAPLIAPEPPYGASQTTGAGNIGNGVYNYAVTVARYDVQGQLQRSAPSTAFQYTVSGANTVSNTVTFKVAPLNLTLLQDAESSFLPQWYVEIWRTTAGGTVFFKVLDNYITWNSGTASPILNDPTALEITVTDTCNDGILVAQPYLYTTGGVLENRCPPTATIACVHKDRVWLAGTDDPKMLWYSQQYTFGEAPGFHDSLTISVEEGGAITALASLDAHLVVFKRDRILFIDGDGPGTQGGSGFTSPQRLSVDLGCINANSVAVVPDGVVFQSTAGIYLLDRALQCTYLSGPVEDTLAANPTITSAVVHESEFQIRWTCNSSGSTGVVLVYDYLAKQWSTCTYYDATAPQAATTIASAVNHEGVYTWVTPTGTGYKESATAYTDAGSWVGWQLETAWMAVGGLQGWQRCWSVQILGERFSAHDLLVEVATDYSPTYSQSTTWTNTQIAAMPLEQVKTAIVNQKCQAIRFRITVQTPTGAAIGTGQGAAITGLLLEAGMLRKAKRLPAAQRG